jgi:diguanylate cyclase (GGDEF)-like protein
LTNSFPVLYNNGEVLFYQGIYIDITYLKKVEEKIKFLSFRDALTGLYNRRFFEEELKRLDTQRNLPLTVVMIDIDGLKLVNDAFGHETGDLLLKKTADILARGCRADDIIGKVGGDEFIILLPRTNSQEAKTMIYRIYKDIKKEKVEAVNISVSCGCSTKKK